MPQALPLERPCLWHWGEQDCEQQNCALVASVLLCVLLYSLMLLVTGSKVGSLTFIAGSLLTYNGLFALHGKGNLTAR
jgi:hypothetical protein